MPNGDTLLSVAMRHRITGLVLRWNTARGFTLIELLVVIAIIAVVAALLLPVLAKTKSTAQSIECLNNLKQLDLCVHLYVVDNQDYFVPNNSVAVFVTTANGPVWSALPGSSWLPDVDADTEIDPSNIINGLLFQYNTSLAIYHCPADQSTLETSEGQPLPQLRWRSYNLSQSVNGYPRGDPDYFPYIPAWTKFTEIRQPVPSQLFVFIDESAETIQDAEFGNPPVGGVFEQEWWDIPSDRHNQGGNLSFADGHVEHWKWAVPKTASELGLPVSPAELPDFRRIQSAMKQPSDD
jgi:prepilin-type N-terminal cleavage/methylation domain-containing protein/prepilin-type processing-associated H-X9-DG protein